MIIGRSHSADTTKGGHADVLPIPKPLVPYLVQAMNDSHSELLFPGAAGMQRSPHFDLKAIVKRTLVRAGLVEKYVLHCRGWKCGHGEEASESTSKRCPRCNLPLWSKAIPRDVGFHGLRHSTATLLLKAKVPYAVVQRILRHRDPRLTTETYGHLESESRSFQLVAEAARVRLRLPAGGDRDDHSFQPPSVRMLRHPMCLRSTLACATSRAPSRGSGSVDTAHARHLLRRRADHRADQATRSCENRRVTSGRYL